MNNNEKQLVKLAWVKLSAYYQATLQDHVFAMYADDVEDLRFDDVIASMNQYRKNPKNRFVPLPAQIRELVCPVVDSDSGAREAAARICAAVPKFGWTQPAQAKEYIGEVGWAAVCDQGGWSFVCQNLGVGISQSAFQAQVRDMIKSRLMHSPQAMAKVIQLNQAPRSGELSLAGETIMKLVSSNDRNQDGI